MIYNHDGGELRTAYDYDGSELESAYSANGKLIHTNLYDLIVMSYNVQWWTLRNANTTMQKEILDKYNADIIGLQEFSKTSTIPALATTCLSKYPYKYVSNHYNFNAIASKKPLENVTDTDFTYVDDERWAYQKGYITVAGKRIAFFNTHLTWRGSESDMVARGSQADEIRAEMDKEEYVIATGDWNVTPVSFDNLDYQEVFKPFTDAGYKMVNYSPETGITKTYTPLAHPTSLDDFRSAPDNIIVSPNISIYRTVFDTTKLKYDDDNYIDHIPVVTYLKIN